MKTRALAASLLLLFTSPALAKVDLVTLPARDRVELTIYNGADLTLFRDARALTLRAGGNRLQFSWAGTLLDPTSLELAPAAGVKGVSVKSVEYPPKVTGLGVWTVEAERSGPVPFEITGFTSGLSWRAHYHAVLAPGGDRMRLEGYVRVDNRSGEEFEGAKTRVVVGRVNLIDEIAALARKPAPYGRPDEPAARYRARDEAMPASAPMAEGKAMLMEMRPREIVKEAMSEYFLYTVEGTEDLPNGWGRRLASFTAPEVGIENLYRYEEERYGNLPVRFLSFRNDEAHGLGREPIPDGAVSVYRALDGEGRLAYVGSEETRYVPIGGEVNLNLGPTELLTVKPVLMEWFTDNYEWRRDDVTGYDEHRTVRVEVSNNTTTPARVEIRRNFPGARWEVASEGEAGEFLKVDSDTVQYTLKLAPNEKKVFTYRVDLRIGSRGM